MPSNIKIEIGAELRDSQGKVIKRFPWKRANSLIKQFIQILTVQMQGSNLTIKDTGGTDRSTAPLVQAFLLTAPAATTGYGTVIGTGTTAVDMTDNKLQTPVSANIYHGANTFAVENPDASTWRVAITRIFTNNTGASLGIKEVALYCWANSLPYYFCLDRTLYSVDVPNGVGVTLTYRITISL